MTKEVCCAGVIGRRAFAGNMTSGALLNLVGPAHQLLLPLAVFKCDVFTVLSKIKFDLI